MIKHFLNSARRIVYIQISSTRITMESNDGLRWSADPMIGLRSKGKDEVIAVINDGEASYRDSAGVSRWLNPFSHPRTILSDFHGGEKLIQYGLNSMIKGFISATPALAIMHPLEKTEGGLTAVERRALKEMALGSGFRECRVYTGPELVVRGMTMKNIESRLGDSSGSSGAA